ncbi:H-NS family nucleoid-associated regulatory protein [Pontivivens ytuae]|uniref:H-NS histone family protein n=1 Tax=Pontivivens ytuae TaxID=2789856 RepID=A0A7S9LTA1_9RHOB|nr:H-NS histone family protein [Pontivivens ytuae]QPH54746.1 H-NS histone family protein [Pontivivens ytuae]
MAKIDLEKLSLEELKQLEKDVQAAIVSFEKRKREDALAAIAAAAKEHGFNLSDLVSEEKPAKGRKQPLPPKYQHPENPSKTWSGRGRQPDWIKDGLASGKALDDFLIA